MWIKIKKQSNDKIYFDFFLKFSKLRGSPGMQWRTTALVIQ